MWRWSGPTLVSFKCKYPLRVAHARFIGTAHEAGSGQSTLSVWLSSTLFFPPCWTVRIVVSNLQVWCVSSDYTMNVVFIVVCDKNNDHLIIVMQSMAYKSKHGSCVDFLVYFVFRKLDVSRDKPFPVDKQGLFSLTRQGERFLDWIGYHTLKSSWSTRVRQTSDINRKPVQNLHERIRFRHKVVCLKLQNKDLPIGRPKAELHVICRQHP